MFSLGQIERLWRAIMRQGRSPSTDLIDYEGRILLQPDDEYGNGYIGLSDERTPSLVANLYQALEIEPEEGYFPGAAVYGRIKVEILPDPDMDW